MILVAAGGAHAAALGYHLKPLGFTLEHYADPGRRDRAPRRARSAGHPLQRGGLPPALEAPPKLAREKKPREDLIFLLIAPENFEMEDAAKAAHLGVNGILKANLTDKQELYRLEEIIRRYRSVQDKRNFTRLVPQAAGRAGHSPSPTRGGSPSSAGEMREISIQGSSFLPARASAVADLAVGSELKNCSLKVEDQIIAVTCKVTRNREELGFQFLSFEEGGHHALLKYIQSRAERALKSATARKD